MCSCFPETGLKPASAICNAIQEWGLQDNINTIVFHTTAINTGRINGTCTVIENLLRKPLVWLACGNYLHETILRCVFEVRIKKYGQI